MVKTDEEFHALMQEVLAGSEAAAEELFRDYGPSLLHAIRRRMNKRIRSQFDSLDFAQDVWASFFKEGPEKRSFNNPTELVLFLTKVAENKIINVVRHRVETQKHDLEREESLDDSRQIDKDELVGAQPTPSQIMMTKEEWVEFLRKQPLVHRRIFILLREGKTQEQIAGVLGIHKKTVQRVVADAAPRGTS